MMETPDERLAASFRTRVAKADFPAARHALRLNDVGVSASALFHLFETQLMSRHLDYMARRLGREKRGFYSIGSAGHEGNAGVAHMLRRTDMAFLHYRSGAFLIERQRQKEGATPLWDMALSFVAAAEDPVSGGRHKVLGSLDVCVPPQTSTIASHLPKAFGAAFSIALSRTLKRDDMVMPQDAVAIASFGDASANHSTAIGAINAAANTSFRGHPLPLIFLCEDNGIGISTPTPSGWIRANYEHRAGLAYVAGDGMEILDALRAAKEAAYIARIQRKPVFLHLSAVRLMGHAGSDHELSYRSKEAIEAAEREDPLLKTARTLIDEGVCSADDILTFDAQMRSRIDHIAEAACLRPKLETANAVMQSIIPNKAALPAPKANLKERAQIFATEKRTLETPQHMSRLISLAIADIMSADKNVVLFGEDTARKGGVYGATLRVQDKIGPARVFDTILDEQTILGLAIGLAQNGFLPMPEIQFLAYVHNAEDQIRGEAATLPFFSNGVLANPMVIRIAGLAYQRGFGGHFHNDNSIAVFRDLPGIILAVPSRGDDAVKMLRECYRLAREERRVVIFLEPIALYGVKDLHQEGDGEMSFLYPPFEEKIKYGDIGIEGNGHDLAIITYGNGAYLSRRAIKTLTDKGLKCQLIDLRWLAPLPMEAIAKAVAKSKHILVVDECRRSASVSEEICTRIKEAEITVPLQRITAEDSFIPLGAAAYHVLPSEQSIVDAALALTGKGSKA